jgi:CheY-like chemotaxis protein
MHVTHSSKDEMVDVEVDYAQVLVVEDDFWIRDYTLELLNQYGYKAVGAENGKEALDYLKSNPAPKLVLTDINMPIMSGDEFLGIKEKDEDLINIPVIIVSAIADKMDIKADGLLVKPYEVDDLLRLVEKYCPTEVAAA